MTDLDLTKLVDIVATGIRVLVTRGTCQLTEDAIYDRARNIVQAVIVNFECRALPELPPAMKIKEWARWPVVKKSREEMVALYDEQTPLPPGRVRVERFPKVAELQQLYAQGKPEGHGHSCGCRDCRIFNQSRRAQ